MIVKDQAITVQLGFYAKLLAPDRYRKDYMKRSK